MFSIDICLAQLIHIPYIYICAVLPVFEVLGVFFKFVSAAGDRTFSQQGRDDCAHSHTTALPGDYSILRTSCMFSHLLSRGAGIFSRKNLSRALSDTIDMIS